MRESVRPGTPAIVSVEAIALLQPAAPATDLLDDLPWVITIAQGDNDSLLAQPAKVGQPATVALPATSYVDNLLWAIVIAHGDRRPTGDDGSEQRAFIRVGVRLKTPAAGHANRAALAPRATVRRDAAGAGRVIAGSENDVEVEDRGDPRQELEPDAFGQAIFDHGPRPLAYAARLAQTRLRFEPYQPDIS